MLDKSKIGSEFPASVSKVELGRLKFFAKAVGETDPVYFDESAARQQGYKNVIAPLTYPMVIDMDSDDDLPPEVELLEMNIAKILHGSQSFEYFENIYAGDTITSTRKLVDIYDKKGGALEFVVTETSYKNQDGVLVAKAQSSLVYKN